MVIFIVALPIAPAKRAGWRRDTGGRFRDVNPSGVKGDTDLSSGLIRFGSRRVYHILRFETITLLDLVFGGRQDIG